MAAKLTEQELEKAERIVSRQLYVLDRDGKLVEFKHQTKEEENGPKATKV